MTTCGGVRRGPRDCNGARTPITRAIVRSPANDVNATLPDSQTRENWYGSFRWTVMKGYVDKDDRGKRPRSRWRPPMAAAEPARPYVMGSRLLSLRDRVRSRTRSTGQIRWRAPLPPRERVSCTGRSSPRKWDAPANAESALRRHHVPKYHPSHEVGRRPILSISRSKAHPITLVSSIAGCDDQFVPLEMTRAPLHRRLRPKRGGRGLPDETRARPERPREQHPVAFSRTVRALLTINVASPRAAVVTGEAASSRLPHSSTEESGWPYRRVDNDMRKIISSAATPRTADRTGVETG